MATKLEEELAEIRAEIARQDAEWGRASSALSVMEECELHVPVSFFDAIEAASTVRAVIQNDLVQLRA